MDNPKLKTEEEYRAALQQIDELMAQDPDPATEAGEKLSTLASLISDYESQFWSGA